MQCTKISTLVCIMSVIKKHEGNYSYASQNKYLELLKNIHKINISRRQLNYHLRDMENEGFIKRIKRHVRGEKGMLITKTTAICMTIKGYFFLAKKGIAWALKKAKELTKNAVAEQVSATAAKHIHIKNAETCGQDSLALKAREARKHGVSLYNLLLHNAKNLQT